MVVQGSEEGRFDGGRAPHRPEGMRPLLPYGVRGTEKEYNRIGHRHLHGFTFLLSSPGGNILRQEHQCNNDDMI